VSRPFLALILILAALTVGFALDSEHPPHTEPPVAEVTHPLPLGAVGGEVPEAFLDWVEGVAFSEWVEGVREAERLAEMARLEAARAATSRGPVVARGGTSGEGCAELAAEFGLPESILWRESRCRYDAFNPTGCGGRGCVGPSQIDRGHGWERSPWGGPGACADLDLASTGGQVECTHRLSGGGSNLRPWGA
jgi:hypothetical protein